MFRCPYLRRAGVEIQGIQMWGRGFSSCHLYLVLNISGILCLPPSGTKQRGAGTKLGVGLRRIAKKTPMSGDVEWDNIGR